MYSLITKNKLLIIIFFIGAFLRLFKLGEYPVALNHDEITQLYDAVSIAQTGKDIYGNFFPFIFPSLGDFKPPFYTYVTSVCYFLFGGDEPTIRLPAAIFGSFLIIVVYFFILKFFSGNAFTSKEVRKIATISALFTAIAPFEIFFSRKSFENGAGILLALLGFLAFFKFFENTKKIVWLYFASIIFAVAIYTYFSHTFVLPLIVFSFIYLYRSYFKDDFKKYLIPILIFLILTLPLIFMTATNSDVRYRSKTVYISQDVALGSILDLAKSDGLRNSLFKLNTIISYSFKRYLEQFDPVYLFANGLDLTNQGLMGVAPLYLVQLPFLILGIIFLTKNDDFKKQKRFVASWVLLGMLPSGLTFESHSPHRVVMVFTMFNVICAIGFYYFLRLISIYKKFFNTLLITISLGFVINFVYFIHIYFVNYPFEKSEKLQYPFEQVARFAWSQYNNYDSIIFDPKFGDVSPIIGVGGHYYLGYYGNYSPSKFQTQFHKGSNAREVLFDKFSIREVYWPADKDLKNTLVIVSPWSVPESDLEGYEIIKKFNFYNGKLAFYAIKL